MLLLIDYIRYLVSKSCWVQSQSMFELLRDLNTQYLWSTCSKSLPPQTSTWDQELISFCQTVTESRCMEVVLDTELQY